MPCFENPNHQRRFEQALEHARDADAVDNLVGYAQKFAKIDGCDKALSEFEGEKFLGAVDSYISDSRSGLLCFDQLPDPSVARATAAHEAAHCGLPLPEGHGYCGRKK